jgi:hypothetical protein
METGGTLGSADDLGQPAADGERRVAVGDQGGDEDLAIYLAEVQDLQSACDSLTSAWLKPSTSWSSRAAR